MLAFGRWRGAPLYEFALARGAACCGIGVGRTWTPVSLLAPGPGDDGDAARRRWRACRWWRRRGRGRRRPVAVVRDRAAGTVSATITASTDGFAMRSLAEQDVMVTTFGATLASFARPQSPVSRIIWQEWSHPKGVARTASWWRHAWRRVGDRIRIRRRSTTTTLLLERQAPVTVAHEVTFTVTVDQRRVRRRRQMGSFDAALAALGEELELFTQRLDGAGMAPSAPLSPNELTTLTRMRSDPSRGRARQLRALRQSLATAAGRSGIEWGPMALEETWSTCRVDESVHRTYRMAALPMLPVPANWLDSLLTDTATTRTVTVVLRADPVEQGGGGRQPGADLDRVVARGQGPSRVPGDGPGTAPPRRRRGPRTGAGPRSSRVPSRRPGHRHRPGPGAARRGLRPDRERGRQVADRSAPAGRPPGAGLGGVAAVGSRRSKRAGHDRPAPAARVRCGPPTAPAPTARDARRERRRRAQRAERPAGGAGPAAAAGGAAPRRSRSTGTVRRWRTCARCTRSTPTAASARPASTSGSTSPPVSTASTTTRSSSTTPGSSRTRT